MKNFGIHRNNSDNIRFSYGHNPLIQKNKTVKDTDFQMQ